MFQMEVTLGPELYQTNGIMRRTYHIGSQHIGLLTIYPKKNKVKLKEPYQAENLPVKVTQLLFNGQVIGFICDGMVNILTTKSVLLLQNASFKKVA